MLLLLHFLFIYLFSLEEKSFWNVILITIFVQELMIFCLLVFFFFFWMLFLRFGFQIGEKKKWILGLKGERSVCVFLGVGLEVERERTLHGGVKDAEANWKIQTQGKEKSGAAGGHGFQAASLLRGAMCGDTPGVVSVSVAQPDFQPSRRRSRFPRYIVHFPLLLVPCHVSDAGGSIASISLSWWLQVVATMQVLVRARQILPIVVSSYDQGCP